MKKLEDFQAVQGWFLDKDNEIGPLTMAFRRGSTVSSQKHYHCSTHEYYLVLCGHATLEVDGEELLLHQNSLAIVEPGEIHHVSNASEDFEVIVVMEKYVPDDKIVIADE